jgi:hypothetical protein
MRLGNWRTVWLDFEFDPTTGRRFASPLNAQAASRTLEDDSLDPSGA